jgi:hypothetical protein
VRRPSLRRVAAALLLAGAVTAVPGLVPPAGAAAQPTTCPTPRDAVATVTLAAPEAGAAVSGRVEVRGRVESPSALFQVELFVGDARKDVAYFSPPAEAADFTLVWDAGLARGGPSTLRVVACGGSADGGSLVSGTGTVEVQVEPSPGPASTKVLLDAAEPEKRETRSLAAGAAIALPAVACLLYAVGRRRRA